MYRLAALLLPVCPLIAATDAGAACRIAGTAYDASGRPLRAGVVRLVDLDTQRETFGAVDAQAGYAFDDIAPSDIGRYRIDLLSAPTIVTGTRIPTRSIVGMSERFACGAGDVRRDVRAQVD